MRRRYRTVTDWQILNMALNTRAARKLRADGRERRANSVVDTGVYLWVALGMLVLALLGTYVSEALQRSKQHRHDCARPGVHVECTERSEGQAGREGNYIRHAPQSAGPARGGA